MLIACEAHVRTWLRFGCGKHDWRLLCAQICDLGSAIPKAGSAHKTMAGTTAWMAPEVRPPRPTSAPSPPSAVHSAFVPSRLPARPPRLPATATTTTTRCLAPLTTFIFRLRLSSRIVSALVFGVAVVFFWFKRVLFALRR